MTRRQFLACLLMALVVLVCLPLVKFAEWTERWFGNVTRSQLASFDAVLKRIYGTEVATPLYAESPFLRMLAT